MPHKPMCITVTVGTEFDQEFCMRVGGEQAHKIGNSKYITNPSSSVILHFLLERVDLQPYNYSVSLIRRLKYLKID